MKVSSERPLLIYCADCGGQGRFHGTDDVEIASHLAGSGWYIHPEVGGGLRVVCPTCYVEQLRVLARAHRDDPAGLESKDEDVVRTKRIEIINGSGKVVLLARAGKEGGQITLMGQDGSPVLMASAADSGGVLGVADAGGKVVWKAPCPNPDCRATH